MNKIILFFLNLLARAALKRYNPRIIAVTGTVGKTSTKDAIYFLLKEYDKQGLYIFRSPKSFNGNWGVPLSILLRTSGRDDFLSKIRDLLAALRLVIVKSIYPDVLVLEMGVNKPNEIPKIASWITLDALVITTISDYSPHLDEFKSPELILKDKASLIYSLKPNGILILNSDDSHAQYFRDLWHGSCMFYGFSAKADVRAQDYKLLYNGAKVSGFEFTIIKNDITKLINISGCVGLQHVYSLLAAISIAFVFDSVPNSVLFSAHSTPPGRMRILNGKFNSTIIDDSFNTSPIAVASAISTTQNIKANRKIIAISYLLGLEDFEYECHLKIFNQVKDSFDIACFVGAQWLKFSEVVNNFNDHVLYFSSSIECGEYLSSIVRDGDLILVKGSQLSRMENIVSRVISSEYNVKSVLVRQEDYWLKIK